MARTYEPQPAGNRKVSVFEKIRRFFKMRSRTSFLPEKGRGKPASTESCQENPGLAMAPHKLSNSACIKQVPPVGTMFVSPELANFVINTDECSSAKCSGPGHSNFYRYYKGFMDEMEASEDILSVKSARTVHRRSMLLEFQGTEHKAAEENKLMQARNISSGHAVLLQTYSDVMEDVLDLLAEFEDHNSEFSVTFYSKSTDNQEA
ncbi:hypothetical protein HDU84_003363 [Entophlyctis sp. JEL0112]|nr:hypothetical protein HDU84_003363 [Entophlyctis sp. JEL0112]